MERMKKYWHESKKAWVIAITQWFITTIMQVDRAFFTYDHETKKYIVIKALYLVFLVIFWGFVLSVRKKLKERDPYYKRAVQIFCVYFTLMMVLLLIVWPGTWSWDDLGTLSDIQWYNSFQPWQHIITGIYQDVMLQIFPFPGGIILLQNVIISICVAFSVTKLEQEYAIGMLKNTFLDILLKLIPFLLPPVLMYQFSGYRMGMYVYLELVMLVILLCSHRERGAWGWKHIILFCFLTMIVSTWRTESMVYIPCICILLCFFDKKVLPVSKKITSIVLVLLFFIGMNQWQNHELKNNNYEIISLMRPCVELVRVADHKTDSEELAAIDKVTDLKVIYDNPSKSGESIYWGTKCVRNRNDNPDDDYTDKDYKNYLKAFIKLSLKYPRVVIAERLNLFIRGSGITGQSYTNVVNAAQLFEENNGNSAANAILSRKLIANTPVFKYIRRASIYALGIQKNGIAIGWLQRIIWNAIIPILILACVWIKTLLQKNWQSWFICSVVLVRVPIVVLTQPSDWFMYLLSFYFLGYVVFVYVLWIYFSKKKGVEENE